MPRLRWFHGDPRFQAADWRCESEDTAPHRTEASPRPAIAFTRRGAYRRHVGSTTHLVDPGAAVSYPQGMEYRVSHPVPGEDRSLVVTLTGSALEDFGVDRLPYGHAVAPRRSIVDVRRVELAAREGARLAVEEILLRLVGEALWALSRTGRTSSGRRGTDATHRRAVDRAKEVIATRYDERLTLDEIARDSGYSAAHLCEVFRQETGIPMHRYLGRLRLLVALEGLEGTENLTRLAYQVGFSTPSHFATAFRREFGHPPSRLLPALRAQDVARLRSSGDFESGMSRHHR